PTRFDPQSRRRQSVAMAYRPAPAVARRGHPSPDGLSRHIEMMKTATLLLLIPFCLPNGPLAGQGLDPALLTKPATDAWPTYAGDYSQRRYSTLRQIDQTNVRHLTLAWLRRLTAGPGGSEGAWFGPPPGPP